MLLLVVTLNMKSKEIKTKYYELNILTFLVDIINDHKTHEKWKVHSGNRVIDYKTQENGKFNNQWQLILYLLRILMKFLLCI